MVGRLRKALLLFVALLFLAGIPGAALREVVVELAAPELPKELAGREGVLDVVVQATDGDARRPLRGARVRAYAILDGRAHDAGTSITDENGRARLDRLPLAEHWIVADAAGRARASRMIVVVPGARRLDLDLGLEHALEVEVKDEQGAPIVGAEIEVRGGGDPFPVGARTDPGGLGRAGRLSEGPYMVAVRASGFEEATRRRVEEGARLAVTLSRQGALLVRVVDEAGAPAPGARVLIASPTIGAARVSETDASGTVRIGGLQTATYALRATRASRVSPIEIGVPVQRGEQREVELRLGPGVEVAARVVDAVTGDDVPGARASLAEGGLSPFPVEAVADRHGRVVLGPISRGLASLSVMAEGFVPKSAIAIDAPPQGEVKVALVRGGTLIGRIKDSRGYAVDGATIRVVGTDLEGMPIDEDPRRTSFREAHFTASLAGPSPLLPAGQLGVMPGPVPPIPHGPFSFGPARSTAIGPPGAEAWVSARDGTFSARPVTPGRIRAFVRHPQYVEAMSELVSLGPDGEARVEIVVSRGGALEGRVVDARGRVVTGAHVTVLATHGSVERTTRTATDGSFAFAALPDSLTVLVSRDEDVSAVAARAEVSVPEGGRSKIEIVLPEPRAPLAVRVLAKERGVPIEGAQVSALSIDPGESLRVTSFSNRNGEAELAGGKGLALRLEIRAPGRASRVMVTHGEAGPITVELAAAESIVGEVTGRRRDPIDAVEITLQTESGIRHARTDREGSFKIGDLSPGPVRVRARAKGFAPATRDVTVLERGGTRPTDVPRIELAEEGVVEGVVVDPSGSPIPGARIAKDAVPTFLPAGAPLVGMSVADGKGHFRLPELAEGTVTLEAYAPDVGRARLSDVRVRAGRTTEGVKIVLARSEGTGSEPPATGGVAVTLGETAAGLDVPEVVIVAVAENSEAERSGLASGDVLIEIGGQRPRSIVDARARLSGSVHDDVVVKVRRDGRVTTLRIAREQVRR